MAGRPPGQTQHVLERITQVLENLVQNQRAEPVEYQGFAAFQRNHPPKFHGDFNPDGAKLWLSEMEKIFEAMGCQEQHKVTYAQFMLVGEADRWWRMAKTTVPVMYGFIPWDAFKVKFLDNYFPRDLRK